MRAISTVLDVTLCLLLVSASVLTLAGTPTDRGTSAAAPTAPTAETADRTAETLATTTVRVTYSVADGTETDRDRTRTVHDTLAGLLASAALADESAASTSAFVEAVTATANRTLQRAGVGVQVVARPIREDSGDRLLAGEPPPPDADVHAAALAVRRVRLTVRTWERSDSIPPSERDIARRAVT